MHGNRASTCRAGNGPAKPWPLLSPCQSTHLCTQQSFHLSSASLHLPVEDRGGSIAGPVAGHKDGIIHGCLWTTLWINIDNINIHQDLACSISRPCPNVTTWFHCSLSVLMLLCCSIRPKESSWKQQWCVCACTCLSAFVEVQINWGDYFLIKHWC